MKTREEVRAFIISQTGVEDLDDSLNIFEAGYVNSLFAMQLVNYLEEHFELQVENEDLDFSNFKSVDAITAFVDQKLMVKDDNS